MRQIFSVLVVLILTLADKGMAEDISEPPKPHIYSAMRMQDVSETLTLLGLVNHSEDINGGGVVANTRLDVNDGVAWFVYGYNCKEKAEMCGELQLRAVFEYKTDDKQPALDINIWNRQNRYVRAYSSVSDKALILEMDIYLTGGVSLSNLIDQILLWRQSLRQFSLKLKEK